MLNLSNYNRYKFRLLIKKCAFASPAISHYWVTDIYFYFLSFNEKTENNHISKSFISSSISLRFPNYWMLLLFDKMTFLSLESAFNISILSLMVSSIIEKWNWNLTSSIAIILKIIMKITYIHEKKDWKIAVNMHYLQIAWFCFINFHEISTRPVIPENGFNIDMNLDLEIHIINMYNTQYWWKYFKNLVNRFYAAITLDKLVLETSE